jgi:hypothetical protein
MYEFRLDVNLEDWHVHANMEVEMGDITHKHIYDFSSWAVHVGRKFSFSFLLFLFFLKKVRTKFLKA